MKEHPMLFSAPMIRALREGRKTVTRRVVTARNSLVSEAGGFPHWAAFDLAHAMVNRVAQALGDKPALLVRHPGGVEFVTPRIAPGDRIWARETWAKRLDCEDGSPKAIHYLRYRADDDQLCDEWHDYGGVWRPSIFMPRWACRSVPEVVSVRPERLHDITAEEVAREGVDVGHPMPARINGKRGEVAIFDPVQAFAAGWDGLNHHRAPWKSNPWVWRYELRGGEA